MEFASLDDAFPNSNNAKGRNSKGNEEGFFASEVPLTDADRPAVKRMTDVPPMRPQADENALDGLLDESSKFLKKPNVNNALPSAKPLNALEKDVMPSYFGAEPFTNPNEDEYALYTTARTPHGYMLEADFTKGFDGKGYDKASGVNLPSPELRSRWKLMSSNGTETSWISPKKSGQNQFSGMDTSEFSGMKAKIDELMARLDDLEHRASGANPQLEVMTFIMTGIFLMFVVDVAVRKSGKNM
jgi:hypothetical protein